MLARQPRPLRAAMSALLILTALSLPAAAALAAGSGGGDQPQAAFDAHATTFQYFFKDSDMDFHFSNLILGAAVNGGAATGEAFYAASQIKDGDAASWQKEWYELAQRVEARGRAALAKGQKVSARDQLLRAANYYRLSLISMEPTDPGFKARGLKTRALMRAAGQLMDPPLTYIEVPFEGTVLPGYFRPAPGGKPAPTLLMIGGGETFAEDLYFFIAAQAFERGYNFATVDLPGQGMMPLEGKIFRTDTYVPMQAVVSHILTLPQVDPQRLAAYGISGGGQFVPQAAMHDPRIKAVAMTSAVVDGEKIFSTMPAATATAAEKAQWTPFHAGVVKSICWRYGVPEDQPAQLIAANHGNTFDPARVTVPALILVGAGEYASQEVRSQQATAMAGFPNPLKKLVVTPKDEGASDHCIFENRALVGVVLFDWLDDVLN